MGRDAAVAAVVGDVPLNRQRRSDLVLVRLGIAAAGDRPAGGLCRQRRRRPARSRHVVDALAAVSSRVRRRLDQAAWRPLLAGPDVSGLPPRDATDAGPAQLVFPSLAAPISPRGSGG